MGWRGFNTSKRESSRNSERQGRHCIGNMTYFFHKSSL